MKNVSIVCTLRLSHGDLVMQNHRVHGVSVMPGVVFLDLVVRILLAKGQDASGLALERIVFSEPVVTEPDVDRELRVRIALPQREPGAVLVDSRPWGSDAAFSENMRSRLAVDVGARLPDLDAAALRARMSPAMDMDELYRRARVEHIDHRAPMRCTGALWSGDGALLAELALEVPAEAGFHMHPAALDATTIAAFGQTPEAFNAPFIPVSIERVRVHAPLPARFLLHSPGREVLADTGDVISNDYDLYDGAGRHCASFRRLTCKRIRAPELITRLLKSSAAPVPTAEASARSDTCAASWGELLRGWIGEILRLPPDEVERSAGFYELGLGSRDLLGLAARLEQLVGSEIYPTLLFEHRDIAALETHLLAAHGPLTASAPAVASSGDTAAPATTAFARTAWMADGRQRARPIAHRVIGVHGLEAAARDRLAQAARLAGAQVVALSTPAQLATASPSPDAVLLFADAGADTNAASALATLAAWNAASRALARSVDVLVVDRASSVSPAMQAAAAFLRCVRLETPRLAARALLAGDGDWPRAVLAELERGIDGLAPTAGVVCAAANESATVQVLTLAGAPASGTSSPIAMPHDAVCVIAGGTGGIGVRLSRWLAEELKASVVVLGRSEPDPALALEWSRLPGPAAIVHQRCDITDAPAVQAAMDAVRRRFGRIDAVFHLAGVLGDEFHFDISPASANVVAAPKVDGFVALDLATANDALSLFCAFSSLAAWRPNPGQAAYAFASAMVEGLAAARRAEAGRRGATVTLAWPLWAEGGMRLDEAELSAATARTGLRPLPTAEAFQCLRAATIAQSGMLAVLHGDARRYAGWLADETLLAAERAAGSASRPMDVPRALPQQAMEIAIVGVAGRYPGASDIDEFWALLREGHDAITEVPPERWSHDAIFDAKRGVPGRTYGRWGGFLDDIEGFDAGLFHVSRREAERADPQERLFLETCWTLMEAAGHPAAQLARRDVGVYVGVMWNHYQLCGDASDAAPAAMHASIANRVSYALDLRGPSMAVDTACSSSLTAISLAMDALRSGACRMAIAGGVNLAVHPQKYLQLAQGQFLSDDGRCRSFGAGGSGYVPGEGVGALLLRPLADALRDGDHVWGIVRGCALNHAGRTSGFTVPSPAAQADVISAALLDAGVDASSISYVEAHGTGTALGDPIEIEGLGRALRGAPGRAVAIGSVKSNIGHLESAAGVAAVTKVLLMMRERELVASLHSRELNGALQLEALGLRVQQACEPWQQPPSGAPRRASVSSFGAGGANAHLVLDELPAPPRAATPRTPQWLVLSARDDGGLRDYARRLALALATHAPVATDADPDADADAGIVALIAARVGVPASELSPQDTARDLGLDSADLQALATQLRCDAIDPDTPLVQFAAAGMPGRTRQHLADVACTLQLGRTHLQHRLALHATTLEQAAQLLEAFAQGREDSATLSGQCSDALAEQAPQAAAGADAFADWVLGRPIDFDAAWAGSDARRVPLPVPRLRRQGRFWAARWQREKATQPQDVVRMPAVHANQSQGEDDMSESHGSEAVSLKVLGNGVAVVRMQESEQRNMFTQAVLDGLARAFADIDADPAVRAVVLTGTEKVFSMGGTPQALERLALKQGSFTDVPFLYEGLAACRVPVVAAMRGHAAGGGLAFGLHADLVVLDRAGTYSANFLKFGFTPGLGATHALEQRFGPALAAEMCLTASNYAGRELEALGASLHFAEGAQVFEVALRIAGAIAENPAPVVNALKRELARRAGGEVARAVAREVAMHDQVLHPELVPAIRAIAADPAATAQRAASATASAPGPRSDASSARIRRVIQSTVCGNLFLDEDEINPRSTFSEMGLDSLGAVEIVRDLNGAFNLNLDSVLVYDHPTVDRLVQHVAGILAASDDLVASALGRAPAPAPSVAAPPAQPSIAAPAHPVAPAAVAPAHTAAAAPPLRLKLAPSQRSMPARVAAAPAVATSPVVDSARDDLAIIGLSARFAGADSVEQLWENLLRGSFDVEEIPASRWDVNRFYDADPAAPGKTCSKVAGLVADIDRFDAAFFGISPREAELMDPQQRVFLEQAWRALEHAGYAVGPDRRVDCGVFVGTAAGDYLQLLREAGASEAGQVFLGNSTSVLAARIAYFLNLEGPTVAVDTACSSSMVALHLACQSILGGDCEMAIAGGIALMVTPQMHIWNGKSGMLSPRGRCAPFDASADGFALGEGVGAVVVKRLSAALADRDHIHAVIKASGVNGDGKTNGITAPSADAQLKLQQRVHRKAGVSPDEVTYIETHGAGTQLGDPIELKALAGLMRGRSPDLPPCGVGSIKSNLGHTTLASGIASLLKVTMALEHGELPPTLHFESLNPNIDLGGVPLEVVTTRRRWAAGPGGRRIGAVNSFGVSGTNAHFVLEEPPFAAMRLAGADGVVDAGCLLALSARSGAALRQLVEGLVSDLQRGTALVDVAYTLGVGRAEFRKRCVIVASDVPEALAHARRALAAASVEGVWSAHSAASVDARDLAHALDAEQLTGLASRFCDADAGFDFAGFHRRRRGRRVVLQGYPLVDQRFWVPGAAHATNLESDPKPARRPTLDADSIQRETLHAATDWLRDHRVQGQLWLPGAALLFHAARPAAGVAIELSEVEWLRATVVADGAVLEIRTLEQAPARSRIELGFAGELAFAQAHRLARGVAPSPSRVDLDAAAAACPDDVAHDALYRRFEEAGIEYGPSYRLLARAARGPRSAVAWLRTDVRRGPIQTLDAVLQAVGVLEDGAGLSVPRRIDRLSVDGALDAVVAVVVQRVGDGRYDLHACDGDGVVVAEIEGFHLSTIAGGCRMYVPRWRERRPGAEVAASSRAYLALRCEKSPALPTWADGEELVVDVRGLAEEQPEQALQAARMLFAALCRQPARGGCVTVLTAGAAAVAGSDPQRPLQAALCSLARSAAAEQQALRLQVIDLTHDSVASRADIPVRRDALPGVVALRDDRWHERVLQSVAAPRPAALAGRGQTCLIVGGANGIGFELSKELARAHGAALGWIGRRPLDERIRARIREIEALGGQVLYVSADLGDERGLATAVRRIRHELGPVSVAVHGAVVLDDATLERMDAGSLERVLGPKVAGIANLSRAIEGEPIDKLLLLSSVAALLDSPGQANYAAASAYLDAYGAELRRRLGVPVFVVDWGYWGSVGVVAGERYRREMAARGVDSIEPADGFDCLRRQIGAGLVQAVTIAADPRRFASFGLVLDAGEQPARPAPPQAPAQARTATSTASASLSVTAQVPSLPRVTDYVRGIFAGVLKLAPSSLDADETFESFGVDSLLGMDILRSLRQDLGALPSTLLYQKLTIRELAGYLCEHQAGAIEALLGARDGQPAVRHVVVDERPADVPPPPAAIAPTSASAPPSTSTSARDTDTRADIAVVGLVGRYPEAPDLDVLWQHLREGRRSLREIAPDRWGAEASADAAQGDKRGAGNWAALIDGVDLFDPRFFGILPSDAATMDPQERLFLETCWTLLEQAGHNGADTRESQTGVFVGIMYGSYGQIAAAQGWAKGRFDLGHSPYWSVANRVSYAFDFNGPSMAVDTACSSSLTAFHLACESLRRGECRQAIAGGVNVILHPAHHIALGAMRMLGTGAACRTFDKSADGIAPGEGVGAVLLRPLADALADGDEILAVVRGSAINAGGKTGGYTVPNVNAQARAIASALARGGVSPDQVDAIEVHGTGTQLGDPIEIAALNEVYGGSRRAQPVRVGSVKSNLGHLEGAAGIAGLTKAILQLRHGELVACAGLVEANEKIDFGDTVAPVRALTSWPVGARSAPGICGVSSFGAGGANAHVVLQRWQETRVPLADEGEPRAFLLSANSHDALAHYARRVADWLDRHPSASLARLGFTSQVGRRHLSVRAAAIAASLPELALALRAIADGEPQALVSPVAGRGALAAGGLAHELSALLIERRKTRELAELWVNGGDVAWARAWGRAPGMCDFPSGPFERKRFWMASLDGEAVGMAPNATSRRIARLAQAHDIGGRKLVPGAALAHLMLDAQSDSQRRALRTLRWLRPAVLVDGRLPTLDIARDGDTLAVRDAAGAFATARSALVGNAREPARDLEALRAGCTAVVDSDELYRRLGAGGFEYGAELRVIVHAAAATSSAIGEIDLSSTEPAARFAVAVDAAMQLVALLADAPAVPSGIAALEQWAPTDGARFVLAERGADPSLYDVTVCDDQGNALVQVRGLALSPLAPKSPPSPGGRIDYLAAIESPAARGAPVLAGGAVLLAGASGPLRGLVAHALVRRGFTTAEEDAPASVASLDAAVVLLEPGGADVALSLARQLATLRRVVERLKAARDGAAARRTRLFVAGAADDAVAASLSAATATLAMECPWLECSHVLVAPDVTGSADEIVDELVAAATPGLVRLADGRRLVRQLQPLAGKADTAVGVRPGAVYLITGGAGALGRIFAAHLLSRGPATVVLVGRGGESPELAAWAAVTSGRGGRIVYAQADVGDVDAMCELVSDIVDRHGPLRGVVHAAGVRSDALLPRKSDRDIAQVLRPKVRGAIALDAATADEPLDFFVLCSSLVAETGNIGQADYAVANRFLVEFGVARERERVAGRRQGATTAVEWPLWADGGMTVDPATQELFRQRFGMLPLPTPEGLAALDLAMSGRYPSFALVARDDGAIVRPDTVPVPAALSAATPVAAPPALREAIAAELRRIGSEYLLVDPREVELDGELLELGFDSISLTDMVNKINARYGLDLLPTVLFECPTLNDVATWLERHHGERLAAVLRPMRSDDAPPAVPSAVPKAPNTIVKATSPAAAPVAPADERAIAIIGVAGRLAGAASLARFWEALCSGERLVGPVPADRQALQADPVTARIEGGFLNDVARFDAERFSISPREAALMDPQQRLLLETVLQAVEDAGYSQQVLSGRCVGMFAGVSTSDYDSLLTQAGVKVEPHVASGVAHSIASNRVSHVFGWHGPSEVVDTACSSSLVALHRAVSALRAGECEMAVAGGVNVTLSPGLFHAFIDSGMLSASHACKTFDRAADGYVRGEGVGAVVLKPLARALADGDRVLAVVRGSAVNHGGRSSSLTAPNPASQGEVIRRAIADAGVDPRRISFIEAHGTGTSLGDPVEIEGLKRGLQLSCVDAGVQAPASPWIALGAVKTAVGHLEAASGMAGLLRTVLSMAHGRLCGNRNFTERNPHVRLDGSPFELLTADRDWRAGDTGSLVAGVSSFGFGGTNCHVVLESAPVPIAVASSEAPANRVFVLSAPDPVRLSAYASALSRELAVSDAALADVAFTLQHGRDALACRRVLVAATRGALIDQLNSLAAGHLAPEPRLDALDPASQALAASWMEGRAVAWPSGPGRRCALPGIPLGGQSHWFSAPAAQARVAASVLAAPPLAAVALAAPAPTSTSTSKPAVRAPVTLCALGPVAPRVAATSTSDPSTLAVQAIEGAKLAAPTPVVASAAPAASTLQVILECLSSILLVAVESIGVDERFNDLGLDSIFRMDLVRHVNRRFGTALVGEDLYNVDTTLALARLVDRSLATPPAASAVAAMQDAPPPALLAAEPSGDAEFICDCVASLTGRRLAPCDNFSDVGLTSFDMLRVISSLEGAFGPMPKSSLFDHPTPRALAEWLGRTYGVDVADRLARAADGRGTEAAIAAVERLPGGAVVVAKRELAAHPDLAAKVAEIEARWAKEGGLPGRDIAPLLFIDAEAGGYLNFTERDGLLLAWSSAVEERRYPALVAQWVAWAQSRSLRPNLLSMVPLSDVGGVPFCSTPFGTVQRLRDIASFSLAGKDMNRLRKKINRFKGAGNVGVTEYRLGSDPATDQRIVTLIDEWAAGKEMVNPYVKTVRHEIDQGILAERHRVFLTALDGQTVAAVVITKIPSENGYLLDLEFFGHHMSDGGLDYTVVSIIERLAQEGVELFSFGATLGVVVGESPNPNPHVERTLRELREAGIFHGDGNFQFKNKYRPDNLTVHLCQPAEASPADVLAVLLLIVNPTLHQATDVTPPGLPAAAGAAAAAATAEAVVAAAARIDETPPLASPASDVAPVADDSPRRARLRQTGWNPLRLPACPGAFELVTDSWAEREDPAIGLRVRELSETAEAICLELGAQDTLPFAYVQGAASGRAAELALLRCLGADKRMVIQNALFQSWTFNQLDLGLVPQVLRPLPSGADVDLAHLDLLLAAHGSQVGLCCIELAPNATGGLPMSLDNLRGVAARVRAAGIPLVFDATRGLENACMLAAADGRPMREVAAEILGLADVVTLSMSKDFGVNGGGLVATNDAAITRALRQRELDRGHEIGLAGRRLLATALADWPWIEQAVVERVRRVGELAQALRDAGIPVRAAGGHAVLVDARAWCGAHAHPVASALAWLYEHVGLRAAPHLSSGLAATSQCVRLALSTGLSADSMTELLDAIRAAARQGPCTPRELLRVPGLTEAVGAYIPREELPADVAEAVATGTIATGANWDVARAWQPAVRRHLLPFEGAQVEVFESGAGEPVVFLHPFNIGAGFFAPQLEALASRRRVVVVHAPGVGGTTFRADLSFAGLSRLVLAAVRGLGIASRFVVAGASFGGITALALAHAHPDCIDGLVLLGSSYKIGNRRGEINRLAVVAREDFDALERAGVALDTPRETFEKLLCDCESMDPKIGLRYLDVFASRPTLLEAAGELTVPVLQIHGTHDTVIALDIARQIAAVVPDLRYEEIDVAGHFPSLTAHARVNALIDEFVDGCTFARTPDDDLRDRTAQVIG